MQTANQYQPPKPTNPSRFIPCLQAAWKLVKQEFKVASYCRRKNSKSVLLENPLPGLASPLSVSLSLLPVSQIRSAASGPALLSVCPYSTALLTPAPPCQISIALSAQVALPLGNPSHILFTSKQCLFICLFLAMRGLCCYVWALSSCSEQGLLSSYGRAGPVSTGPSNCSPSSAAAQHVGSS